MTIRWNHFSVICLRDKMILATYKITKRLSDFGPKKDKMIREMRKKIGGKTNYTKFRKKLQERGLLISYRTESEYCEFGDDRIIGIKIINIYPDWHSYETVMEMPELQEYLETLSEAEWEFKVELKSIDVD